MGKFADMMASELLRAPEEIRNLPFTCVACDSVMKFCEVPYWCHATHECKECYYAKQKARKILKARKSQVLKCDFNPDLYSHQLFGEELAEAKRLSRRIDPTDCNHWAECNAQHGLALQACFGDWLQASGLMQLRFNEGAPCYDAVIAAEAACINRHHHCFSDSAWLDLAKSITIGGGRAMVVSQKGAFPFWYFEKSERWFRLVLDIPYFMPTHVASAFSSFLSAITTAKQNEHSTNNKNLRNLKTFGNKVANLRGN